jgi:hypothetical protein
VEHVLDRSGEATFVRGEIADHLGQAAQQVGLAGLAGLRRPVRVCAGERGRGRGVLPLRGRVIDVVEVS